MNWSNLTMHDLRRAEAYYESELGAARETVRKYGPTLRAIQDEIHDRVVRYFGAAKATSARKGET